MDPRVRQVLKDHGIESINSEKFRLDNHEDDNRIIFDFDYIVGHPDNDNFPRIVGYSEHPTIWEREEDVAVMFEDRKTLREYWCHIPGIDFEPHTIERIFNIEELINDNTDWEDTIGM